MERRDLYQDDLTEERQPTPAQRDDVARSETLDPDVIDSDDVEDHLDDVDEEEQDEDEDDVDD